MRCCTVLVVVVAVILGLLGSGRLQGSAPLKPLATFGKTGNRRPELVGLTPLFAERTAFGFNSLAQGSLKGVNAIVTGASTGTGWWTAFHLARKGANVVIVCAHYKKCYDAAEEINKLLGDKRVISRTCEFDHLDQVRVLVNGIEKLWTEVHILVMNEELRTYGEAARNVTEDGIETMYQVNHLSHFLMFKFLRRLVERGAEKHGWASIVVRSDLAQYTAPKDLSFFQSIQAINDRANWEAHSEADYYAASKVTQALFVEELARQVADKPIFVNAYQPGLVWSKETELKVVDLFEATLALEKQAQHWIDESLGGRLSVRGWSANIFAFVVEAQNNLLWSLEDAALTQVFLAASPRVRDENIRGKLFHQIAEEMPHVTGASEAAAREAWALSDAILREKGF